MAHRVIHASAAAIAAMLLLAAASAHAQYYGPPGWTSPEPNYYGSVPGEVGLSQAMYPCPRPTPPLVGQTLITYPPFAPQNMMYLHWTSNGALCNGGLCCGLCGGRACGGDPCGDQCDGQCNDPCDPCCRGLCRGGLCCRGAGTTVSVMYGHHYHLLPHPSLRNQAVGLRTPANAHCGL
jgi:hypothetical protein